MYIGLDLLERAGLPSELALKDALDRAVRVSDLFFLKAVCSVVPLPSKFEHRLV